MYCSVTPHRALTVLHTLHCTYFDTTLCSVLYCEATSSAVLYGNVPCHTAGTGLYCNTSQSIFRLYTCNMICSLQKYSSIHTTSLTGSDNPSHISCIHFQEKVEVEGNIMCVVEKTAKTCCEHFHREGNGGAGNYNNPTTCWGLKLGQLYSRKWKHYYKVKSHYQSMTNQLEQVQVYAPPL